MESIFLIDDHPLARSGIGAWLERTGRFTIAAEASALAQARSLLETIKPLPSLIILDVSLGAENGLSFITEARAVCKERKEKPPGILVCSMYDDPFLARNALESGADGYISKSADSRELIAAIDAISGGKKYIEKNLELQSRNKTYAELTRREREILTLLKRSLNNRQIAETMGISLRTVENHLGHIYLKTGAVSRGDLFEL